MIRQLPALIPLALLAAAVLIPLLARFREVLAHFIALTATTFTFSISVVAMLTVLRDGPLHYYFGGWIPPIGIEYVLDVLSAFFLLVINAVSLLVIIHSSRVTGLELSGRRSPYLAVVMLLLCGFNGIVLTGDFFNLYVFLEISSLAGYGLIAAGEKQSPVAAFRYLIMGTIGASFYLLGLGFLFIVSGSLNMFDLREILPLVESQQTVVVALTLMAVGMALKMALFPMHGWLADAYTYAPSTTSALIAPIGTKIGAYVLIRVLFFVFGARFVSEKIPLTHLIAWLSAAAIVYGSIAAMAQDELKRLLAYSSVAQIGYIGLGIGLANPLGLIGAILHVLNHAFMKGCLFLVTANLRYRVGHSSLRQLDHNMRRVMPWTLVAFTVAALSMVGLPPLAGFFSKWYLVRAALEQNQVFFVAVILVSSLLNAVYFFRVLERVYLKPMPGNEPVGPKDQPGKEAPASLLVPVLVMALALLMLGLFNAYIVNRVLGGIVSAALG